jgi:hypothetical protein
MENLIEEVEDLARSEKREIKSRLRVLLMHLLKWQYQPHRRTYPETSNVWKKIVGPAQFKSSEIALKTCWRTAQACVIIGLKYY